MRHILVVFAVLAGLAFPAAASAVVRGANVPAGDAPLRRRPARRRLQLRRGLAARVLRRQPRRRPDGPDRGALRRPRSRTAAPRSSSGARTSSTAAGSACASCPWRSHPGFDADDVPQRRRAPAARVARPRGAGDARRRSCARHVGDGARAGARSPRASGRRPRGCRRGRSRCSTTRACVAALAPGFDPATQLCAGAPGVERRRLPGRQRRPAGRRVRAGRRDLQRPRVRPVARDLHPARRAGDRVVAGVGDGAVAVGRRLVGRRGRGRASTRSCRTCGASGRSASRSAATSRTPRGRPACTCSAGSGTTGSWCAARRSCPPTVASGSSSRAPRWPRLRVMVVGSGGSRPAARR